MNKSIKRLMITGISVMTIASMIPTNVFAAKRKYSFSVKTSQNSGMAYSAANPKDDNEQTAYVYTTSGNIVDNDIFYMAVYKTPSSGNKVTKWKRVMSNSGKYLISYTSYRGKGSNNYLCGDTDKYSVSVEGYWYS